MVLSRVVSEIFNVEKYRDLEIRVRGHLRSLQVVPFDRLHMVSYYYSITISYYYLIGYTGALFLRYSASKMTGP